MVGQKYYSTCTFACICAVVQWCEWCSGAQGVAPGLPIGSHMCLLTHINSIGQTTAQLLQLQALLLLVLVLVLLLLLLRSAPPVPPL